MPKSDDDLKLRRSFKLLTDQLMEIEKSFNVQIQQRLNNEIIQHHETIYLTSKSLDTLYDRKH